MIFLANIFDAIQVDFSKGPPAFAQLKRAFTPQAVQKIHGILPELWPDYSDFKRCLEQEGKSVTALYVGNYQPEAVFRAVVRQSLYCERILLVDPFLYPGRIRDEFNPILHPEEHRGNAVKFSYLWMLLSPWIQAGIVSFIRTPGDFLPHFNNEVLAIQREKYRDYPELAALSDSEATKAANASSPLDRDISENLMLSFPDEQHRMMYRNFTGEKPFPTEAEYLAWIQYRRDTHPYWVEWLPKQTAEFQQHTSGTNYETAKRICAISRGHIVTDLPPRWKEVEIDHRTDTASTRHWEPFAKALQNAPLKVLDNVPLEHALRLREEKRLANMRMFFTRIWNGCRDEKVFSELNAENLAAELEHEIGEAEVEWRKIDQELMKWVVGSIGLTIVQGAAGFYPGALATIATGVASVSLAKSQRENLRELKPAAFFLGIR